MKRYSISTFAGFEQIIQHVLGLFPTRGSGNVRNDGDAKGRHCGGETYHHLLVECKYTEKEKQSSAIRKKDWYKTEQSAYRYGRIPVMATSDASGEIYVHLSLDDFTRIYTGYLEYIEHNKEVS